MKNNIILMSCLISILAISFCGAMERQEAPETRKRSKSYVLKREEKKDSTNNWFKSLTSKFTKDKVKEKSIVETKFDVPPSRDNRRSFSLVIPKIPKPKHNSVGDAGSRGLLSKTPQTSIQLEEELAPQEEPSVQEKLLPKTQALLVLSRQAGIVSCSGSPELERKEHQAVQLKTVRSQPSLTTAQVLLGRKAILLREKYAKGRSGRDSQVKITAREYVGDKNWEAALMVDPSEDTTITPRTDETVTPRTEEDTPRSNDSCTPRTEDTTTPRDELETPRMNEFASPCVEKNISLEDGAHSNNN